MYSTVANSQQTVNSQSKLLFKFNCCSQDPMSHLSYYCANFLLILLSECSSICVYYTITIVILLVKLLSTVLCNVQIATPCSVELLMKLTRELEFLVPLKGSVAPSAVKTAQPQSASLVPRPILLQGKGSGDH